ncbi:hypothetical protein [Mesorhizobium sp. M4B.F.Ca.ET.143.01.1.1]|uniref:hypothetical protein n=1 Tax=Mesorhizobium sp. M4B.F.Ca.ET.143.01.1.1 TaxID=2563947 RepID=UPI001093D000|nr:hypothetical protein [Mesorhizobium sp. M4B.F.Ca.ET.143.01.1.1]TGV26360.1 hypothetical protein EN786_12630 [Mesorhizobium sp. M4B.F.Ca.ET.143.01.1.1]
MSISKETAIDIALAYREIETAEGLLADINKAVERREVPDVRDAFGRLQGGFQLGVPTSDTSRTLFNVPWNLARPIIEAHIAAKKSLVGALNEKARVEIDQPA